ncbi:hypothetical protein CC78DRAFT_336276 [Lojkania enalia]|uniref:Transcription factor domain-containing protein n=1 Tax=Lojkania enalia TaxID=147567 RepID=A0A9P4N9F6_9PLEO|nr:hypothetical protein CC78DRAFT_336276 [Didymosphaeria enalia]
MIQYRYKADQQKRRGKVTPGEHVGDQLYRGRENSITASLPAGHQEQERPQSSTPAAWCRTGSEESFGEPAWHAGAAATSPYTQSSRYRRALSSGPPSGASQTVSDYEESDDHETRVTRLLTAGFARLSLVGDSTDPFCALPQFKSPELDFVALFRKCVRTFTTPSTVEKWLPPMLSHPHVLLSATILTSTYMDMHAGCSGDSKRTALVKGETISWINERLARTGSPYEDFTVMVILHLLAGEMWSCNEKTLRIHEGGLARLITQRGGMQCIGVDGILAEVAASCCYHCDIFCEATPLPLFYYWEPPNGVPVHETAAIPESPIFCPRSEFFTILGDPKCCEITYNLLCDMRDLTNAFLAAYEGYDTVQGLEVGENFPQSGTPLQQYELRGSEIRARLASLPSAYTPGLTVTNDWVYEACRLAAIIYTSAITMRVPFSVAAQHGHSAILSSGSSPASPQLGDHPDSSDLIAALYEALRRTNTDEIWGPMSGVLYWAAMVGAAAARTPSTLKLSQTSWSRSEAYAIWVRRCLIMIATRAMIILVFQHPLPVVCAQKRMLRVQQLIGSGGAK